MSETHLSGRKKAAIFLLSIGEEQSAKILKYMKRELVEDVSMGIAEVEIVHPDEKDQVMEEFRSLMRAHEYIIRGGVGYAEEMLSSALGPEKAAQIIEKVQETLKSKPFDFLRKADPNQLYTFIANEHPQIQAFIISHLKPEQASIVLSQIKPEEKQVDVAKRIAAMEGASPELIEELEDKLSKKISGLGFGQLSSAGGIQAVAEILNKATRATEKTILEGLEENDPELAQEIKKLMFVFEDIVIIDNLTMQKILRDIDVQDLALAMKVVNDDVKRKILDNVSQGMRERIEEELEYMGPVRLREVEEAQEKIVSYIRRLEEEGSIIISRGDGEDVLV